MRVRIVIRILYSALWLVYAGRIISVINFALAQRLGLRQKPDDTEAHSYCLLQSVV